MMQCSNRAARMVLGSLMSLTLTLAVCGEDSEERTLTKSFTVEPGGLVSVTASQGDIEMVTGKQNAVEIVVEREVKGANESEAASLRKKNKVSFSQEGNNIYVESGEKGSKAKLDKLEIHIRVATPRKCDALLETSGGTIAVTGLQGSVEVKSGGGDMCFTNIHGLLNAAGAGGNIRVIGGGDKLQVSTSGGEILIQDYKGPGVKADSLGGNITVRGCTGTLAVKTSGGNIALENFSGPQATADTAGGELKFDTTGTLLADSFLRTTGGNIVVTMPESVAVDLTATTDGGVITTEIPVEEGRKGRQQLGRLEGKTNGGGPKLMLKTGGGNIEILKK